MLTLARMMKEIMLHIWSWIY